MAAVWLFFPETNGRHLEEVDQIFLASNNIFDPVKVARNLPQGIHVETVSHAEKGKDEGDEKIEVKG